MYKVSCLLNDFIIIIFITALILRVNLATLCVPPAHSNDFNS